MKKTALSLLAIGSILLGAPATRATVPNITIDDFVEPLSVDPLELVDDGSSATTASSFDTGLLTTSVIGGTRFTQLEILDPGSSNSDRTSLTSGSSALDQSIAGDLGNQTKTTLLWNANGTGLNLGVSGYDRLQAVVSQFSLYGINRPTTNVGSLTWYVSDGTSIASFSQTFDEIFPGNDTTLKFLFSAFSNPSVFNNPLQSIELVIESDKPGLLFTINRVEISTPEPSLSLASLALAGAPIILRGWRKRQ